MGKLGGLPKVTRLGNNIPLKSVRLSLSSSISAHPPHPEGKGVVGGGVCCRSQMSSQESGRFQDRNWGICHSQGPPRGCLQGPLRAEVLCCWSSQKQSPASRPLPSLTFLLPNEIWQLLKIAQRCSRHSARPSAGWHTAGGGHCGQTLMLTGPGIGVTHTVHWGSPEPRA